jgi:hypothetical protein
MNCHEAQSLLSLYLYGELDFAHEEEIENHLAQCAFCELTLTREKQWHTLASGQVEEPSLDLLSECRQRLRPSLARETATPRTVRSWWRWANPFDFSVNRWSSQLALGSLLVFAGFAGARWLDHSSLINPSETNQMGVFNPAKALIRDIQSDNSGRVRIVLDQESEITGPVSDTNVRRLVLSATRQSDAGVRFYAVQLTAQLLSQGNSAQQVDNIRQVLLDTVRNDPNAAVRLEAINGIRHFSADPAALETLKFVLQHDDNPGNRYQAINILAPQNGDTPITPEMRQTIEDVLRSSPDDYVHTRCAQYLEDAKLPLVY